MEFGGVYTAILTPFLGDGSIDWKSYEEMVERQVASGISGIVVAGTTGESPTLSGAEMEQLFRKTVQIARKRLHVIAGSGGNSTASSVETSRMAQAQGVDAVMLVSPYYNKPSQEGLYQHFTTVAQALDVPVILYNIAGRTAVNLEVETLERLMHVPNIQVVKEASGDVAQMIRIQKACGDHLTLLSGDDNLIPAVMGIGGKGVISVVANLYPKRLVRMVQCFLRSDFESGNAIFYEMQDLLVALFWQSNPIPVKAGANFMGLCPPNLRLPMTPLPEEFHGKLKAILDRIGEDD